VSRLRTTKRRVTGRRGTAHHRVHDARAAVAEQLVTTRDKITPGLERARETVTPGFERARDAVEHAREAAAPQLASARQTLVEDVIPRVGASVAAALAASEPMRDEAKRRGTATVAALKGDIEPPAPPKRRRRLGRMLFLTGLSAAAAAAVKTWRDSKNRNQWTTADTYVSTPPATPTVTAPADAAGASPDEALADEARATVTTPRGSPFGA